MVLAQFVGFLFLDNTSLFGPDLRPDFLSDEVGILRTFAKDDVVGLLDPAETGNGITVLGAALQRLRNIAFPRILKILVSLSLALLKQPPVLDLQGRFLLRSTSKIYGEGVL